MTELFVFTLLAAIVAVYGILPKHRQLRVGYGLFAKTPIAVLSLLGLVIISTYVGGIFLQPQEKSTLGTISLGTHSIELTQVNLEIIQLTAVLGIVGIFGLLFVKDSVRVRNEEVLISNLRRLYNREDYATLVDLIREKHTPLVNHPNEPSKPTRRSFVEMLNESLDVDDERAAELYEEALKEADETTSLEETDSGIVNEEDENSSESVDEDENTEHEEPESVHIESKGEKNEEEGGFNKIRSWIGSKRERVFERVDLVREQVLNSIDSVKARVSERKDRFEKELKWKQQVADYRLNQIRYELTETAEGANDFTETLLLDPQFRSRYPALNPGLGVEIIDDDSIEKIDRRRIVHRFLETLLKTENSLMYREVRKLTQHSDGQRYSIEPENRLIHVLFSDCERAQNLDVYKPIGDTAEEILLEQERKEVDKYNGRGITSSKSDDDDQFRDPLFIAISYFDIMLKEALHQQMTWHFWLFYYDSMTKFICRNYKITSESEPDKTYSNDYSRLLFEMIDNMVKWLDAVENMITEDNYDTLTGDGSDEEYMDFIKLDSTEAGREQNNIPRGTVNCLISCHRRILVTDEIPPHFKEYLTQKILEKAADLRRHEESSLLWRYSELLLNCIEHEGERRANGDEYRMAMCTIYRGEIRIDLRHQGSRGQSIVSELDDYFNIN